MTMESMAILTYCDGRRRESPPAQVLLTRWELGVIGYALRWPLSDATRSGAGGHYLAEAAHRYVPATRRLFDAPESDDGEEHDTGDTGYWLDARQVQQIFANLGDRQTRDAIVQHTTPDAAPPPPDRLIACLQMLSRAVERRTGVHFAYYLV